MCERESCASVRAKAGAPPLANLLSLSHGPSVPWPGFVVSFRAVRAKTYVSLIRPVEKEEENRRRSIGIEKGRRFW